MDGSHQSLTIAWDHSKDEVTITYDPKRSNPKTLGKTITDLGYTILEVESPKPVAKGKVERKQAPLPKQAPKSFADAFNAARKAGRPIVIDFWATWCPPCIKLKHETLEHADVAKLLEGVELIYVDLDQNKLLAKTYGVESIPDVFFIDRQGFIVDRLKKFEEPAPFLARLKKLTEVKLPKDQESSGEQRGKQ